MGLLGRAVDWLTNRYDQVKKPGEWIHFHHVGNELMELRGAKGGFGCPACAMGDPICMTLEVVPDPKRRDRLAIIAFPGGEAIGPCFRAHRQTSEIPGA